MAGATQGRMGGWLVERSAAGMSLLERLAMLDPDARLRMFAGVAPADRLEALLDWRFQARPAQLAPDMRESEATDAGADFDWAVWLILAGRGFGKTRAGAQWVSAMALAEPGCRIALLGSTMHDVLTVMVKGESGIANVGRKADRPALKVTARELRWRNGSVATLFSAVEPDSLRGPQFHYAWCDELAAWPRARAVWDNLKMGLRLGANPRVLVTTTPRPMDLLRELLADGRVSVSRGSSHDNAANLPQRFLDGLRRSYGTSALGRQEVLGEMVADQDGALWSHDLIDRCRGAVPDGLTRVVVGVDPPAGPGGCGIVVAGLDGDGVAHVLADASLRSVGPETWARAVAAASARFSADRVVVEINNGGQMVADVLRGADIRLPLKTVHASRGKSARAEPIAALYAVGRVRHCGGFPQLEDEMCGLLAGGGYVGPGQSPDRADALVWALSELLMGTEAAPRLRAIV